jgi:hypothetical protein
VILNETLRTIELVCKLHGFTYKENHGFGIAEEAEWIEFEADGDPLDQGVQVQIPIKARTKSKVLCDGGAIVNHFDDHFLVNAGDLNF